MQQIALATSKLFSDLWGSMSPPSTSSRIPFRYQSSAAALTVRFAASHTLPNTTKMLSAFFFHERVERWREFRVPPEWNFFLGKSLVTKMYANDWPLHLWPVPVSNWIFLLICRPDKMSMTLCLMWVLSFEEFRDESNEKTLLANMTFAS